MIGKKGKIAKKLWLEAVFDSNLAEELFKNRENQILYKSAQWYQSFQNELIRYGVVNPSLESFIKGKEIEKLSKEELNQNLRSFMERVFYEGFIRKNI